MDEACSTRGIAEDSLQYLGRKYSQDKAFERHPVPNITMIKSKRMIWMRHVARVG